MPFIFSFIFFFVPVLTGVFRLLYRFFLILKTLWRVFKKGRSQQEKIRSKKIEALNHLLGSIEYCLRPYRNFLFGIFYLCVFLKAAFFSIFAYDYFTLDKLTQSLTILLLVFYSQNNWNTACLKIAEHAKINSDLSPTVFFKRLKQLLGPIPWTLPDPNSEEKINPDFVDYRKTNRPKQKYSILFPILWDTAILAHICLKCMKFVGLDYTRPIFDVMASMWGKRTLERLNGALTVNGSQKLKTLKGKFILIFNHKSQIDFILPFFALSHAFINSKRALKPRFITAKDHFVDNPFVYDMIGVGKLIEAVDMVFIERTKKGSGQKDLDQAATFLSSKDIDIAIFPQGTRALGNYDRSGKRRDAGYYTTLPPKDITNELGHLRKGASFLAADTLIRMSEKDQDEELHLIVIGLKGTASIMPKESLKMQTETEVTFEIMDPITLPVTMGKKLKKPVNSSAECIEEQNYLNFVEEITKQIDKTLISCLQIHESLYHRFLVDMQGQLKYEGERLSLIETNLNKRLPEIGTVFYQSLDRIYGCPQSEWNRFLSQLGQLLIDEATLDRFKQVRDEISQTMLGKIKTKLHGQKVQIDKK